MDYTKASNGSELENKDVKSLDTKKAKRQQGKSNLELAKTFNDALKEYLDKADKRITQAKHNSPKELANITKVYDARSAMTALVNTFQKKAWYHDFRQIHKGVITEIESMKKTAKQKVNSNDSDSDYSDDNESNDSNEILPVSNKKKTFESPRSFDDDDDYDDDNVDDDDGDDDVDRYVENDGFDDGDGDNED
jgi:hypothetical protein